jgi:hypothetical protein
VFKKVVQTRSNPLENPVLSKHIVANYLQFQERDYEQFVERVLHPQLYGLNAVYFDGYFYGKYVELCKTMNTYYGWYLFLIETESSSAKHILLDNYASRVETLFRCCVTTVGKFRNYQVCLEVLLELGAQDLLRQKFLLQYHGFDEFRRTLYFEPSMWVNLPPYMATVSFFGNAVPLLNRMEFSILLDKYAGDRRRLCWALWLLANDLEEFKKEFKSSEDIFKDGVKYVTFSRLRSVKTIYAIFYRLSGALQSSGKFLQGFMYVLENAIAHDTRGVEFHKFELLSLVLKTESIELAEFYTKKGILTSFLDEFLIRNYMDTWLRPGGWDQDGNFLKKLISKQRCSGDSEPIHEAIEFAKHYFEASWITSEKQKEFFHIFHI